MTPRPELSQWATSGENDRDAAALVGAGGLCAAVLIAAVAVTFLGGIWAAGLALAWLLLLAGVCFLVCVTRLPRRRT